jgi:hypothetical protein
MTALFLHSDTRITAIVVAVLFLVVGELGYRWGKRSAAIGQEQPLETTLAAAFGVVALLLAFSFQLSVTRFDERRAVLVREANAIGTTILRTELLDPATRTTVRAKLKDYVKARIDVSGAGVDQAAAAAAEQRSDALQSDLWRLAMTTARRDPRSTTTPLFITTLNEMIDLSGEQKAVLAAIIPEPIIITLLVIVLISGLLLGIHFGRTGKRGPAVFVLFAVMLGLVIGIILDMDRPQHGLIKIDLAPLRDLNKLF